MEKTEWTTQELQEEFEVIGFLAPSVEVIRKRDRVRGWMEFTHMPRKYFGFVPDNWRPEQPHSCVVCGKLTAGYGFIYCSHECQRAG